MRREDILDILQKQDLDGFRIEWVDEDDCKDYWIYWKYDYDFRVYNDCLILKPKEIEGKYNGELVMFRFDEIIRITGIKWD